MKMTSFLKKCDSMTKLREDNYIEDWNKEEGHVDTRNTNFDCDNPDENLGCDLGIDVAG